MNPSTTRADAADTRWQRVDALFNEALDVEPAERAAFLDQACRGDADLRHEVEALLATHAEAEHFLDDPTDWFEVPPLPGLAAGEGEREASSPEGQRIGAYRLVEKLGEGGMGTVYLAERADGQFEHRAALKLVRAGLDSDGARRRFRQERQILARLSHPNIASLLDGGVTGGPGGEERPYLVMELVAGEPLTAYCDRHRLLTEARLALFAQVCEAVAYAHRMLVVHRDLKPSNVLVAEREGQPQPKLLDFGIARLLEEDDGESEARTSFPRLTPEYAAPEQVRGEAATTATDVYALGVVLYELLTGHRPYHFARLTPSEVERVVCEQEPERPSTAVVRPPTRREADGTAAGRTPEALSRDRAAEPEALRRRLRGDLDTIVLKALRKEPAARYTTADALLEDVRRHLAGLPVSAHAPTLGYRAGKFVRRHRWGVAAAAAFALLLLGATVVTAVQSRQIRRQAGVVIAERDRAQSEAGKATRVTDFLLSLFEANDPNVARGDTLTAGALMARGLREANALGRQPDVQAQMLEVIGRTYESMGRPDLARAPLDRALALRRRLHPAPHPDLARSLHLAASISGGLGDYGRAEPLYREALALRRGLLGAGDPDLGATLYGLAGLLHFQGRPAEADTLFGEALHIFQRLRDTSDPEAMRVLADVVRYLHYSRSYAEAEPLYRRAIRMQEAYYGETHPAPAATRFDLANVLSGMHRYRESEQVSKRGLDTAVEQLGEHHEVVRRGRRGLAMALYHQGRYAEAEQPLRQALGEGPYLNTYLQASLLLNLSLVLMEQGRLEEAERAILESIRLRAGALGERNAYTGEGLVALGRLERMREDYDAATAYLTQARAFYASSRRPDYAWQAGALMEAGHVEVATGAFAEAEPLLREALAVHGRNPDVHPHHRAEARRLLGVALTHLGRYGEAEGLLRASLRTAEGAGRLDQIEEARRALRDLATARRRALR